MRRSLLMLTVVSGLASLAGCGEGVSPDATDSRPVRIVAAESFWGSIASQIAGGKGQVQSIVVNPASDPHSYDPEAADARSLATARLVIVNGAGYDAWAPRLLAASPARGRAVLTVGAVLRLRPGDNPHRWYDPADVRTIAAAITAALERLRPRDSGYFARQLIAFESQRVARYEALIAAIRSRYAGVGVGASESIFAPQAPALGLRLLTPVAFMKATSEGTEVNPPDVVTTRRQIDQHQIKVWIYNSQNTTPEIQELNRLARRRGIPIATVTETLSPASLSFEDWQVAQLEGIARALRQATGRG